jgi:hypothetical protein
VVNSIDPQLPLSFFATLFGMNNVEFNDGHLTLHEELVLMCKCIFSSSLPARSSLDVFQFPSRPPS